MNLSDSEEILTPFLMHSYRRCCVPAGTPTRNVVFYLAHAFERNFEMTKTARPEEQTTENAIYDEHTTTQLS